MPKLNHTATVVAFQDSENTSNPLQKYIDWKRSASGIDAKDVKVERLVVMPGSSEQVEQTDGGVLVGADATFTLQPHPTFPLQYQVRANGTDLDFLGQTLAVAGAQYSIVPSGDGQVALRCETEFSQPPADPPESWVSGGPFAALQRADKVYIAGAAFGDTGSFDPANTGFWTVVRVGSYQGRPGAEVILSREDGETGAPETVTVSQNRDLQRIVGVQPYFKALIQGVGSSLYYSGCWDIAEAAKGWFTIKSLDGLPTLVNGQFERLYLARRYVKFLRIEVDRVARIEFDQGGANTNDIIVAPLVANDPKQMGWFETHGVVTSLAIHNHSPEPMTANVLMAYEKAV